MLRISLKGLLARKLRLLLTGLAVVLGVMFVSGAMVLTDTLTRSFERALASAYDHVDVVVTGPRLATPPPGGPLTEPVDAATVGRLEQLPQVAKVVAEIWLEGTRAVDGDGRVVSTFSTYVGSNWPGESELVELRAGSPPASDDEVAINAELARAGGFGVGDRIGVLTREPRRDFTVAGIFGYAGGRDSWFGETQVAFTDPVAQELLLAGRDVYTELSLTAAPGMVAPDLREAVQAELTDGFIVQTGDEALQGVTDDIRDELSVVTDILLAFAVVALIVGAFLVLNTFSMVVAQRMRELALLRAVGADRRQVVRSVLVEAVVIGVVASTLGLLLGVGVAWLLTAWLGSQMQMAASVAVPAGAVAAAYAVGVGITAVAALVPAVRAARVSPVAAMRGASAPQRSLRKLTLAGGVLTAIGASALTAGLTGPVTDTSMLLVMLGVVVSFVGVVLLTPGLVRPVTGVIGRAFAWSVPGELGRRNTARQPRRTAVTASALMIGVALVTLASTFFGSFAESFARNVDARLDAELVVAGEPTMLMAPTFDIDALDAARNLDDVAGAVAFWDTRVRIGDDDVAVRVLDDLPAWLSMTGVDVVAGAEGVDDAQLRAGEVALAGRIAERQELSVGDELAIGLPLGGERTFTVAAVYEHNDLFEVPLLSAEDADELGLGYPNEGFVSLVDGADDRVAAVRRVLEAELAGSPDVAVHDRSGFVEQQTREFDDAVAFVQVLLVLAMVIAVLGVVNTLVLSIVERTRELGLLRAIGLGRGATARMVAVESVVVSLFGALLGVVTGAGLGAAIVRVLRDEGFGHLVVPWGLMAGYLVAAVVVGVAAAVGPAVRAARLDVLAAIADE